MIHSLQRFAVNTKSLSKKYKIDVNKIIKAWKKGYNDFEVASSLGIDICRLAQLRYEIELEHQKNKVNFPFKFI